ncbi:MAG: hypothetical protein NTX72_00715 [Candidatus Uhrbacteria bacterium]|nr:hypothetical protein [Candidatus Uhrbacteria bacterium]
MQKYWHDFHTSAHKQEIKKGDPLNDPDYRIVAHMGPEFALIQHIDGRWFTVHDDTYPEIPEVTAGEAKLILNQAREGSIVSIAYYKAKVERAQNNLEATENELHKFDELLQTLVDVQVEPEPTQVPEVTRNEWGSDRERAIAPRRGRRK